MINATAENTEKAPKKKRTSPVRWITTFVLILCGTFLVWHIYADRFVPYTDQARVHGLVIPITPLVSGYLTEVHVGLHSIVPKDSVLFMIDKRSFELSLKSAEVNIDIVTQKMGGA